jgi:hypothetical protein
VNETISFSRAGEAQRLSNSSKQSICHGDRAGLIGPKIRSNSASSDYG